MDDIVSIGFVVFILAIALLSMAPELPHRRHKKDPAA
jgi:hypothetical protein